jgi:hypothetical protein
MIGDTYCGMIGDTYCGMIGDIMAKAVVWSAKLSSNSREAEN